MPVGGRDRRLASASISAIRSSILGVASRMAGDDIRSQAIAAAAATLSDSAPPGRSGIVTCDLALLARTSAGSPSRSAPRQRVAAPASASSPSPPWATSAARGAGVSLDRRPRASGWAKIEPMLARTAFGEKGSAQLGAERRPCRRAARAAVRTIVPTLPGSPTPCR